MLESLPGFEFHCIAPRLGSWSPNKKSKHHIPRWPSENWLINEEPEIEDGTRVMLTNNINLSDRFMNGAMGTARHVAVDKKNIPIVILVQFDNIWVGQNTRKDIKWKHICKKSILITWFEATFCLNCQKNIKCSRTQFPLNYCRAITIHKLQGMMLDNTVIKRWTGKRGHLGMDRPTWHSAE